MDDYEEFDNPNTFECPLCPHFIVGHVRGCTYVESHEGFYSENSLGGFELYTYCGIDVELAESPEGC